MTRTYSMLAAALLAATTVHAQQPPRATVAADHSRTVTMSLTEYNRLIDLASRPASTPPAAPVAATLASADLRVRVDRDTARGTFVLAGDVLRPGVNRVNLIAGAILTEASVDGRALPLVSDGTMHAALLPGPGPFAVSLEWGTPLAFAPGRASFTLPVPPAGAARATLDIPGEQAEVRVSAGVVTRRAASGGRTLVDVTLKPGQPTEVWWSMRDSAPVAAAREVRMLADVFTLVTLGDSDVRMAALVDVTVAQGDPRTVDVRLPAGYELTGISGTTIESSEPRDAGVVLTVTDPAVRRHQFLVTLERSHGGGSFSADTDFIALPNIQRERGEVAIEGVGTLELDAAERAGMHRIDVKELNASLQSLARLPMLAAFRYQRNSATQVALTMKVQRFPDAGVLAAVADRATATTMITAEGRALTEVVLHVRNRAQPFLKVMLPAGATIVSADVEGESAKPVLGTDAARVPLLRPGYRPTGAYPVSFVYLHAGTPFAKKGELPMALPKMDIPIGLVEWEMFVPESYRAEAIGGNVMPKPETKVEVHDSDEKDLRGLIHGTVKDSTGSVMPGVTVAVHGAGAAKTAVTGPDGRYVITGLESGRLGVTAQIEGFPTATRTFEFDQRPRRVDFELRIATVSETVSVVGQTPPVQRYTGKGDASSAGAAGGFAVAPPSQNVLNLQKRAAGVLPIRIDVPRAGTSHQFVKPLVVDQEATVTLRYKRR